MHLNLCFNRNGSHTKKQYNNLSNTKHLYSQVYILGLLILKHLKIVFVNIKHDLTSTAMCSL